MDGSLLCNGLDVPVTLSDGRATNLGHFRGQKLIVFFCPADDAAAGSEILAYEARAHAFENAGAWVVGIVGEDSHDIPHVLGDVRIHLGIDPDGAAFRRLSDSLQAKARPARAEGATFVIGRDGGIDQAWSHCGHAAEALEAARERP